MTSTTLLIGRWPAAASRACSHSGEGPIFTSVKTRAVKRGQLGADRKSLALNLEFRAGDRTLTDEEVAARREAIKAKLGEIGGALRE